MSATTKNPEPQMTSTKPIIAREHLRGMLEGSLLSIVKALVQTKYPKIKPMAKLAEITGAKESMLEQAEACKCFIGGKAWSNIEKEFDTKIYHHWLDEQEKVSE